jgi:hypothetical protein
MYINSTQDGKPYPLPGLSNLSIPKKIIQDKKMIQDKMINNEDINVNLKKWHFGGKTKKYRKNKSKKYRKNKSKKYRKNKSKKLI